jgi:hypothetical protein
MLGFVVIPCCFRKGGRAFGKREEADEFGRQRQELVQYYYQRRLREVGEHYLTEIEPKE